MCNVSLSTLLERNEVTKMSPFPLFQVHVKILSPMEDGVHVGTLSNGTFEETRT